MTNPGGSLLIDENRIEPRKASPMAAFTVRLDDEKTRKLDQLASKLDRPRSWLAAQAIDDYLAREEWQIAEIEAGLAEADQGAFASTEDLARVVAKYATPGREP